MRPVILVLAVLLVLGLGCGLALAAYLLVVPAGSSVGAPPTLVLPPAPGSANQPTTPALVPVDPAAATAAAATLLPPPPAPSGPFNGVFQGTLTSDDGSSTPATLELSQNGQTVTGRITIGQGLSVNGGNCGGAAVPAGSQTASGAVDLTDPNRLLAGASFDVQGIGIKATLDVRADPAAGSLSAQTLIDLPFLCGRDPVISGVLYRAQ